jgi:hypothetical protein
MAASFHRPLKIIAFNANGIWRQGYELSKQLQDSPKYHFYRTDRFPGRKGGTAVAVRKGITHNHVDLPPLVAVEATGACIPIGNSEVLLAALY